jgi:hypothetical protein
MVAVVSVEAEETNFVTIVPKIDGLDHLAVEEVYQGDIFIIYDCNAHDWRQAYSGSQSGSINLNDVKVLFGTLPDCDYIPQTKPPDDVPNDVWPKKLIFLEFSI